MNVNRVSYTLGLFRLLYEKERSQNSDANEANVGNTWSICNGWSTGAFFVNASFDVSGRLLSVML